METTFNKKIKNQYLENFKILIVEDNLMCASPVLAMANSLGCQAHHAYGGIEASHILMGDKYDLLILDWIMPTLNGSNTMKVLENQLSYSLPLIVHSGVNPKSVNLPHVKKLKFVDYWKKPLQLPGIYRRLESIITRFS